MGCIVDVEDAFIEVCGILGKLKAISVVFVLGIVDDRDLTASRGCRCALRAFFGMWWGSMCIRWAF